jgi:hypothetical protein
MTTEAPKWQWIEGTVDPNPEHFRLLSGDGGGYLTVTYCIHRPSPAVQIRLRERGATWCGGGELPWRTRRVRQRVGKM